MLATRFLLIGAAFALGDGLVRADVEAELLRKFARENKEAAQNARREAEDALVQANSLRTSYPERAQAILRAGLEKLGKDTLLPREERLRLGATMRDALAALAGILDQRRAEEDQRKLDAARAELAGSELARWTVEAAASMRGHVGGPPSDIDTMRKPPFFTPVFVPVPVNVSMQVTPTVSADRRWVRIGVSQGFVIPKPNFVAIPVATPTVLQGPGKGLTVTNPVVIKHHVVAVPSFITGNINTTAVAPDGGLVSAGGFSSTFAARNEFSTPILGRIPYINPLFRNVGWGASASSFSVGVSPRIIILEEEERRLLGR